MSAESKKRRGESGRSKAAACPFRLNGWPPDWAARAQGCNRPGRAASGGSTSMRGMVGGMLAQALGYTMVGDYERIMMHAQARCTHPLFLDDGLVEPLEFVEAA